MNTKIKTGCHHCGSPCRAGSLVLDGKNFCCNGCLTIYELFRDSGNESFYSGKSMDTGLEKYAFLDNYDIARKFINFSSDGVNQVSLSLPAVHCSSCVYVLENLPRVHEGIIRLSLNFGEKTASIYYDPGMISLRQLASLLDSIGYAPGFDLANRKEERKKMRTTALRIGIAGFCFGNIMLLSFPSYLGMSGHDIDTFGPFFGVLMLLLSLPVMFYAGKDFLVSAFKSIISGHIHIDVPIALGMITLFLRSAYEIMSGTGEGYLDSLSGLIFFLLLGRWFQEKAYRHLSFERDYTSYFPLSVLKQVRNGEWVSVGLQDIEISDVLTIRNNEILPADATLLSEDAMIDYSFVTGEDRLVRRQKNDFLYAGGRQMGASIRVRVNKPCSQSYLTQLWNNPAFSRSRDNYRNLMINKVSRYFTWIILGIALVAGISWSFMDSTRMWEVISAVLIVACPCALALATPFTNGNTLRIFGRNNFFLRNADTAESIASADFIVLDKTGTMTSPRHSEIIFHGEPLSDQEKELAAAVARHSTHPVSRRICDFLSGHDRLTTGFFSEHAGKGIEAMIGDHYVRIGSEKWISGKAISDGHVFLEIDHAPKGYFELRNTLRPGLLQSIHQLSADYPLIVLSGDSEVDKEWLVKSLPEKTEIHFNMSPFDKLEFIKELQSSGKKVLMIGDGLNDAGALRQSDTGVAVTEDISQFSPASDGILQAGQLINLPAFLQFSRSSLVIILMSFILSFLYNIIGLSLAVGGMLTPVLAAVLMPVSSITVVAFTTAAGNFLAKKRGL